MPDNSINPCGSSTENAVAAEQEIIGDPIIRPEDPKAAEYNTYLRMDRVPHIWCSGCGIGTTVNMFIRALIESKIDKKKICVVSGIGCSGRVAGYLNLDSFHTTHGRAIPFAIGLKMANPELHVVVVSGDGDIGAIGGNHLMHAARRNYDIKVVCINNFVYSMTGGQAAPTSPKGTMASTAPFGYFMDHMNLAQLVDTCGASFISRWTTYHIKPMQKTFEAMMKKSGFAFVEVLSPCPTLYGRRNNLKTGIEQMMMFKDVSKIQHGTDPRDAHIIPGKEIIVGNFVDRDRPTYLEAMNAQLAETIGKSYQPYQGAIT